MRLAEIADTIDLISVYQNATTHANIVGKIDWPNPIPENFVAELISSGELFCFEEDNIVAAAKISLQPDIRIWGYDSTPALYLSKLATTDIVRGKDYFRSTMIPCITEQIGTDGVLRLDCLADNERLQKFYIAIGFIGLGDAEFFSLKQNQTITVTRFERSTRF